MENEQFDPQQLLEKVLSASQEIAQRGKAYAEDALDIPEVGEEREQKLDGLKKGAIATAILVGLLGTKGGRSLTSTAIKIGGVAALGTAAYKGYQSWQDNSPEGMASVHKLEGDEANSRAFLLISAMVSAANADAKLDDAEAAMLKHEILDMKLSRSLFGQVSEIIDNPLSAADLSSRVADPLIASEVYAAARIFIDENSSNIEKTYLNDLVAGLGLNEDLATALDQELR